MISQSMHPLLTVELQLHIMKSDVEPFTEGSLARSIEHQTAKLPSDIFLWAALASIATSLVLQIVDRKMIALFVGHWAAGFGS